MGKVPCGVQICLEHQPDTHGVPSHGGGVHRGPEGVLGRKQTILRKGSVCLQGGNKARCVGWVPESAHPPPPSPGLQFKSGPNTLAAPNLKLETMSLNGDDLQDRQLDNQHFGLTPHEAAVLQIPVCSFQVQAGNEATWEWGKKHDKWVGGIRLPPLIWDLKAVTSQSPSCSFFRSK